MCNSLNKENIYKLTTVEDIKRFLIGGKAVCTLESHKTGRWFTYKIRKAKKDLFDESKKNTYWVSVLNGNDNEKDYKYLGSIFVDGDSINSTSVFKLTKKSTISEDALSYKAFSFFFQLLVSGKLHEEINIYHRGVCARCGRTLTVPESLITGLGPECRGLVDEPIEVQRKKKLQALNRKLIK